MLQDTGTDVPSRTLKRLCPTRWTSRDEALTALRFRYKDVLKTLTDVSLKSKNADERDEANGLKNKLQNFLCIFLVVIFSKIFSFVSPVSRYLQSKSIDMKAAETHLKSAYESIKQMRENFVEMKTTSVELARTWGVEPNFQQKRLTRVKKHFDELSQDERIEDGEKRFQVEIYNQLLDILVSRLGERFKSFSAVIEKFNVLSPTILDSASDEEVYHLSESLREQYKDLMESFPQQMVSFRSIMRNVIKNTGNIMDLAKAIICEHSTFSSNFPEVCTAYILFITLPVTTATAERSFSKLKIIKSYLRSTMSQERLSGLSLLSIENETARKLDFGLLIDSFAASKSWKRKLVAKVA